MSISSRVKEKNDLRKKLEEEHGVVGHPKAELLFEKAWEFGHGAGLQEVAYYYDELVDLIK